MVQETECLLSKCEAQRSNPRRRSKERERREEEDSVIYSTNIYSALLCARHSSWH
jgi:hypothetical protein